MRITKFSYMEDKALFRLLIPKSYTSASPFLGVVVSVADVTNMKKELPGGCFDLVS